MSTTPFQRRFLDWHQPLLPTLADQLVNDLAGDEVWDLSAMLVLVPTRETGRRLREALAYRARQADRGLFPPRVWPAYRLLASGAPALASPLQTQLLFTQILAEAAADAYPALFPAGVSGQGSAAERFNAAFRAAQPLCELRSLLTEGGIRFRDVNPRLGEGFEDALRWQDLAALENTYEKRLAALHLQDPLESAIQASENPQLPPGIKTLLVAAVPDLPTLVEQALRSISTTLPVDILVHAPEDKAEYFDDCGRPDVPAWQQYDLGLEDEAIHRVADSAAQAEDTVKMLNPLICNKGLPPASVAIGVPDETVIPPLRQALSNAGLRSFDPGGIPLLRHPLSRLVQHLADLSSQDRYEDAARLLRHPHLLDALRRRQGEDQLSLAALLRQADRLQNQHLPLSFSAFAEVAAQSESHSEIAAAEQLLSETVDMLRGAGSFYEGLRSALSRLYEGRRLAADSLRDREFQTVATALAESLDALEAAHSMGLLTTLEDQLAVLAGLLKSGRYYFPEPGDDIPDIELQGWLELHWNDAPHLILTGFNDQVLPESVVGHPFLPDSLRTRLNITNNERRFARDSYLLQAMLASRQASSGALRILLSKQNSDGDVLRPSRLLFQCDPAILPARALRLFGPLPARRQAPVWNATWPLKPPRLTAAALPGYLRVTDFRSYLECPFRFYLKRLLRMEAQDDRKRELDSMDFGTICHQALKAFGQHPKLHNATDPDAIAAYLTEIARRDIETQYGANPPAALLIQLDSILQRLRAAAEVQARERADGWEIIAAEVPLREDRALTFSPLPIRGTIDRIDRHADGRLRLLDYKTTDSPRSPDKTHWGSVREQTPEFAVTSKGNKKMAWKDLQLPLYALLCEEAQNYDAPIQCGYFILPKAVTQTGIALWADLSEDHLQSAARCAGAIARCIQRGEFWPPSESLTHDDFDSLFFGSAVASSEAPQPSPPTNGQEPTIRAR